jgi:hypothetical protein
MNSPNPWESAYDEWGKILSLALDGSNLTAANRAPENARDKKFK